MTARQLNITTEKEQLAKQVELFFNDLVLLTKDIPPFLNERVERINLIRSKTYEKTNQLQHRSLLIRIVEHFISQQVDINLWTWHPEQSSDENYADITGFKDEKIILNIEATTSSKAIGKPRLQMKKTLASLNSKQGKKYYFVQTTEMYNSALRTVKTENYDITVEKI